MNYQLKTSLGDITTQNKNDYHIELFTQNIPEPPCVLLRWRFIVQAQFYTHMGYILHLNNQLNDNNITYENDEIKISN
jgi:hypothetical protein